METGSALSSLRMGNKPRDRPVEGGSRTAEEQLRGAAEAGNGEGYVRGMSTGSACGREGAREGAKSAGGARV